MDWVDSGSKSLFSAAGGRNREDFCRARLKQDRRRGRKRGSRRQNIVYN
jgi:hypothetical protein